MGEKRFKSVIDEDTMSVMPYLVSDNEEEAFYNLDGCVDLLNMLHNRLIQLSGKLCEKQIEIDRLKLKVYELQQKLDVVCEDNDYGR